MKNIVMLRLDEVDRPPLEIPRLFEGISEIQRLVIAGSISGVHIR